MAESILNISKKLGNLLLQAGRSLRQLKNDVEFIKDTLEDIGSDLKKFAVMTDDEEDFDKRVRKLTQLAFEAEDVIEVFVNNATPYQGCNILPLITGTFSQCITLKKLKNEVDDLKSKLSELQPDSSLIKDPSGSRDAGEGSFDRLRKVENEMAPSSNDEDDEMVGFKDVADKLLSLLTTKELQGELHVVSILADAGAGKTALAWNIYKTCYVGHHFDCVAWFSVSPNCRVEDVWNSIVEQVKKQTGEVHNEHGAPIASVVGATLQGKDYLIILDDLWKTADWERITKAFPKSPKKKCSVLITTRIDEVARSANPATEPFILRPLDEKEGFDLFLKRIFKCSPQKIPHAILTKDMKRLARELVSKCQSLPIAIVLLGGLLSGREKNVHEWNDMLEKFHSHLRESRVFRMIFSLSYNDLEYTQKSCFLYLALFPEDSVIDCDKLVRLWVAEGFFEQKEDDAEDLGRKCVKSLIGRSMIGVVEKKLNGAPRTCRIHDLVRFTVEEEAKKTKFSSTVKQLESVEAGIRRIAVHPNQGIHEFFHIEGKSSSAPSNFSFTSSAFVPSDIEANDILDFFNEEENQVASLLMKEEPLGQLDVVSITGRRGIGKTTLASKIYRRFDIKSHFACCAWVTVSEVFSILDILKTILQQVTRLTDAECKLDDEYELREMLHHHLKEKSSYLIIMDNFWRREYWDILEGILPTQSQKKCRVLLTTHNEDVASYVCRSVASILKLRLLNDDESLQLFFETLSKCSEDEIQKESVLPKESMNLVHQLLRIFPGNPFLIVLLGGFLSVRRKDVSALRDILARVEAIARSTKIAYYDPWQPFFEVLPDHLRYCLLLCLLFPEGIEIHCDTLTGIWVAKGILKPGRDNKIMEDVARNCLKELIQRNLIQVTKRRSIGAPETCRIHDIIRALCSIYANKVDLPFSLENTGLESVEGYPSAKKDSQAAHKEEATYNPHFQPPTTFNLVKALLPVLDLFNFPNHLHSLLCFSKTLQVQFKAFPLLRVLDLEGAENIDQLPNEIGNLTLLRYLGLRGTRVSQIPPWIANLLNLQTLDAPRAEVPLDILRLSQLRHLFAHSFYAAPQNTCFPNHSSSSSSKYLHFCLLKQLQTLEVDIDDWKICDLHECTKLRVLKLRFRRTADTLLDAIKNLTCLMFLSLTQAAGESSSSRPLQLPSLADHRQLIDIVVEGAVVTEAKDFPRLVTYLWLEVSIKKQVDPFSRFQELSYLKKLCLRLLKGDLSSDVVRMTCSNGGFQKLEFLYIKVDFKLEDWIVEEGAFPILKVLHIEGEGRLGKLPDGLKHVKTLKELIIPRGCDVPQSLNDGREVTNKVTITYLNQSYMRP